MNAKFWAINIIAFTIILSYTGTYFYLTLHGVPSNPFWESSPFQVVFMIAFFYLVGEGKLVQKVILAKKLKQEGTHQEFSIINKSSNAIDKMILDKIKKS